MTLEDGTRLPPALGIGAFAEKALVAAGQCTKVRSARAAAVGLLGCGMMAWLGAAMNTGNVQRGQSVPAIGCGGASVQQRRQGAPLAEPNGSSRSTSTTRMLAKGITLGATRNSRLTDPVAVIKELAGNFAPPWALTPGAPMRRRPGRHSMALGRPDAGHEVPEIPLRDVLGGEAAS